MKSIFVSVAFAAATIVTPTLVLAQDVEAGAKVFRRCQACHTVEEGGANKVGPNLWGIFGATAAGRDNGFNYSKAMRDSGIVWNEENLEEYLENPRESVPKTRMSFPGLKKDEDRENVIAYLKSVTQ